MRFIAESDSLTIILEGWEAIAGLKRRLIVPRSKIVNLTWQPEFVHRGSLFRVAGTGFPGVLYAGYYRANRSRAYLYLKRPRGLSWTADGIVTAASVLVISTDDYHFPLIALSCQPEIGAQLEAWFRSE